MTVNQITQESSLRYQAVALIRLANNYGDRLEQLFAVEKLQLIGAIGLWMADCSIHPDVEWLSLGDHVAANLTVDEHFDAFDAVQNEADFSDPQSAIPLLKALIHQVDQGIWLEQEE